MSRIWDNPWRRVRRITLGGMAAGAALVLAAVSPANGQGFGPDPFRPYNSQYDAYTYPVAPSMSYGYNNAPPTVGAASRYENYLNSLNGMSGRGGSGVPYHQADRAYDEKFGRVYRPNVKADAEFEKRQERANDIYFKYFREKDSKKRAQLLRDYHRARSREEREANTGTVARSKPKDAARSAGRDQETGGKASEDAAKDNRSSDSGPPPIGGFHSAARRGSGLTGGSPARRAPRAGSTAASTGSSEPARRTPKPGATAAKPGAGGTERERTPEEVLERAKATEPRAITPPATPGRRADDGPPPIR